MGSLPMFYACFSRASVIISANLVRGTRSSPHVKHGAPHVGHGPPKLSGFSILITSWDTSWDAGRPVTSRDVVRKRCCSTASFVKSLIETPVTRRDASRRVATSPVTVPRRILSSGSISTIYKGRWFITVLRSRAPMVATPDVAWPGFLTEPPAGLFNP